MCVSNFVSQLSLLNEKVGFFTLGGKIPSVNLVHRILQGVKVKGQISKVNFVEIVFGCYFKKKKHCTDMKELHTYNEDDCHYQTM